MCLSEREREDMDVPSEETKLDRSLQLKLLR